MKKLSGVITALPTPFLENGSLDVDALEKFVDFQIENGVSALLPVGTTGESPTLSHDEHAEVIRIVIKQAAGRVPVQEPAPPPFGQKGAQAFQAKKRTALSGKGAPRPV